MNTKGLTAPQRRELKRIARRVRRRLHMTMHQAWITLVWCP